MLQFRRVARPRRVPEYGGPRVHSPHLLTNTRVRFLQRMDVRCERGDLGVSRTFERNYGYVCPYTLCVSVVNVCRELL